MLKRRFKKRKRKKVSVLSTSLKSDSRIVYLFTISNTMSLYGDIYPSQKSPGVNEPPGEQGASVLQPILPAVSTELYHAPSGVASSFTDVTPTPVHTSLFQQRLQPIIMQQPVPVRQNRSRDGRTSLSQQQQEQQEHHLKRYQQQLLPKLALLDVPSSSSLSLSSSPSASASASLSSLLSSSSLSSSSTSVPLNNVCLPSVSSVTTDTKFNDVGFISGHPSGYVQGNLPSYSALSSCNGVNSGTNGVNASGYSYGPGYPTTGNDNNGHSDHGVYTTSTSDLKECMSRTGSKVGTATIVGVHGLGGYTPATSRSHSVNSYFNGTVAPTTDNYSHAGNIRIGIPDIIQAPVRPSRTLSNGVYRGTNVRIDNIPVNDHNIPTVDINSQRMESSFHYNPSLPRFSSSSSSSSSSSVATTTATSSSPSSLPLSFSPAPIRIQSNLATEFSVKRSNSHPTETRSTHNTHARNPTPTSAAKCHKTHKCNLCEKSFIRKSWLERHLLSHSIRRNFLCPWCLSKHKRKDNLLQHIKLKHNNSLLEELQQRGINFNWNVLLEKRRLLGPQYVMRDANSVKELLDDGILNKVDVKRVLDQIVARGRSV